MSKTIQIRLNCKQRVKIYHIGCKTRAPQMTHLQQIEICGTTLAPTGQL
jgi:hypothetical protein